VDIAGHGETDTVRSERYVHAEVSVASGFNG
jgi:hypothetical protein